MRSPTTPPDPPQVLVWRLSELCRRSWHARCPGSETVGGQVMPCSCREPGCSCGASAQPMEYRKCGACWRCRRGRPDGGPDCWAEHLAAATAALPEPDRAAGSVVSPHCAGLGLHHLCPGCPCTASGCHCGEDQ